MSMTATSVSADQGAADLFYSIKDLESLLGLSRMTVLRGLQSGQIPSRRIGKKYFCAKTVIHAWLDSTAPVPIPGKPKNSKVA